MCSRWSKRSLPPGCCRAGPGLELPAAPRVPPEPGLQPSCCSQAQPWEPQLCPWLGCTEAKMRAANKSRAVRLQESTIYKIRNRKNKGAKSSSQSTRGILGKDPNMESVNPSGRAVPLKRNSDQRSAQWAARQGERGAVLQPAAECTQTHRQERGMKVFLLLFLGEKHSKPKTLATHFLLFSGKSGMEDFKSLQPSHTNTSYLCTKLQGAHISLPHQFISWKEKELQEKWALCVCMLRGKQEIALGNLQEVFIIHKVHQFNRINNLLFIIRALTNPIK